MSMTDDEILYDHHPSMFRNHPILFVLNCVLCLALIGIPIFIVWALQCRATRLTISPDMVVVRRGILSKRENQLRTADIRNVQLEQGFLQRILGVGTLAISSAGQSGIEIRVEGIPSPEHARDLLNQHRT